MKSTRFRVLKRSAVYTFQKVKNDVLFVQLLMKSCLRTTLKNTSVGTLKDQVGGSMAYFFSLLPVSR